MALQIKSRFIKINKYFINSLLFLWTLQSVVALFFLLQIPADTKKVFFLGFSLERLILILILIVGAGLGLGLLVAHIRTKQVQDYLKKSHSNLFSTIRASLIVTAAYFLILWLLSLSLFKLDDLLDTSYQPYFVRLSPIYFLFVVSYIELGLFVISSFAQRLTIGLETPIKAWKRLSPKEKKFAKYSILLATLVMFLIMEIGLRIFYPQLTYSYLQRITGTQYMPGDFITFTLKPGYEALQSSQEFPGQWTTVRTNSLGLRGDEISLKKPADTKRILVLGDSYTFGVYVENNETYPAVLQELLRKDGHNIEVINAGYADGWDPDEHYAWLVNSGLQFEPDLIIYGFFIGNDISELYPQYWQDLDENGLPTRVIDDRYYVDKLGGLRATTYTRYSAGTLWLYRIPVLRESHVLLFLFREVERWLIHRAEANDNSARGGLPFLSLEQSTPEMKAQEKLFLRLVEGLSNQAHEHNAEFLVVMLPISWQVNFYGTDQAIVRNYYEEVKPIFDEMGIAYIDMFKLMIENPGHYFPDNGEVHNNPDGYRFIAEQIKAYLDAQGLP